MAASVYPAFAIVFGVCDEAKGDDEDGGAMVMMMMGDGRSIVH